MAEFIEEIERLSKYQYACNRCMFHWDNSPTCPMCGNEPTHELREVEATNEQD